MASRMKRLEALEPGDTLAVHRYGRLTEVVRVKRRLKRHLVDQLGRNWRIKDGFAAGNSSMEPARVDAATAEHLEELSHRRLLDRVRFRVKTMTPADITSEDLAQIARLVGIDLEQ